MLVTAALVVVGSVGVGIFLCMPVVAPALVDVFGFSNKQVGEFSFVQLAFVSLGSLAGMLAGNRFAIRSLAAFAIVVLLAMDLLSPFIENYPAFLIVRGVAGIAGGVAVALATGALAQLPGAERNFGWFLFFQISFSMASILLIPQLVGEFGIKGAFHLLAAVEILTLLLLIRYVPSVPVAALRTDAGDSDDRPRNSPLAWFYSCLTLVAILAFFVAIGSFWTFVGLIGSDSGLSAEVVGKALSLAGFGGILGSLIPIVLQKRIGGFVPLVASFGVLLLAIYLTSTQSTMVNFTVSAMLFVFGWYIFNPYQLGVLASIDHDGRPAMASAALTGLGLGIGPAVVSRLGGEGYSAVYTVSTISLSLAILILTGVIALSRKLRV